MEFEQAVRRRRMVRSFTSEPVPPSVVDEICNLARRAPTAGNTAGIEFLVLEGSETAAYWDVTLPPERRDGFAWPGLLAAPVLVVVWVDHVGAYREPVPRARQGPHTDLGRRRGGLAGALLVRRRRSGGDDSAAGRAGPWPRCGILRYVQPRTGRAPAIRCAARTGESWARWLSATPLRTTARASPPAAAAPHSTRFATGPVGSGPALVPGGVPEVRGSLRRDGTGSGPARRLLAS